MKQKDMEARLAEMLERIVQSAESIGFGTDDPIQGSECVDMVNDWYLDALSLVATYNLNRTAKKHGYRVTP